MQLQTLLSGTNGRAAGRPAALLALLNLGLIESLASGMLSPGEAVRMLYNAENCLFFAKRLRQKIAGEIVSRGTQLPDLFEALPADETLREFQHELAAMRALCLRLLEKKKLVA